MNKVSKVLIIIICSIAILSGVVYAGLQVYKKITGRAGIIPTFTSNIDLGSIDTNKVWVGTFNLAWNELMNKIIGEPVEFEGGNPEIANDLNKQNFTKEMLNENSYYIEVDRINNALRKKIQTNLKNKFNTESDVLNRINWDAKNNEYLIYAMLNKNFTFETPFPIDLWKFKDSEKKFKFFELGSPTMEKTFEQVTALFYNSKNDFAVKIDTKEGEELILYRTDNVKNFSENYKELQDKAKVYNGKKELIREKDELKVPFINVNTDINYDELCNRTIKGTNGAYIKQAVQTVKFKLDNYGGNLTSEGYVDIYMSDSLEEPRYFYLDNTFVLYMKEKDKTTPYFALLVDNTDVLVENDRTNANT